MRPVRTDRVTAGSISLLQFLDTALPTLHERTIVAVTSKVISLCDRRVVLVEGSDREELIRQESDLYYFPEPSNTTYRYHFTISHNTLAPAAGIDTSNGGGYYVLWPEDPHKSANLICAYLRQRFGLREVGVLVTDSTVFPSRWGTMGIALGYSGFFPTKNYIGTKDLFGKDLLLSKSNVAGGLASAAVVAMGEGAEQTPIAIIEDVPFVAFNERAPSDEELAGYYVSPLEDPPFAPFFRSARWENGGRQLR